MSETSEGAPIIRALVVDDQTLLRQGFQRLLELDGSGVEVVGAASDGLQALEVIERLGASTWAGLEGAEARMPVTQVG